MILDKLNEGADRQNVEHTGSVISDMDSLLESFIYADLSSMDENSIKEFLNSDQCKALQEANLIGRKTIVRLSRADDIQKRIALAALQKAKEDGDPNYIALKKVQAKRMALKSKILQKYGNRVKNDAIKAQRALIRINPRAFTAPIR